MPADQGAEHWGLESEIPDAEPGTEPRDFREPTFEDPCGGSLRPRVRALCEAKTFVDGCFGNSCSRPAARVALDCLEEAGEDDTTFIALTHAPHGATRTYARSVLLRRGSLSLDLIREGLSDDEVVRVWSGCFGWDVVAAEVALVALLQRDDPAAIALLNEVSKTLMVKELVRGSLRGDTMVARSFYGRVDGATWRAIAEGVPEDLVQLVTTVDSAWHYGEDVTPHQVALGRWTNRYPCIDERILLELHQAASDAAERERLLELEARARAALEPQ